MTLIYGGSFDPPHMGHAMVLSWLRWRFPNENIWIVPSYAHAFGKESSPFSARVEWCKALRDLINPVWVAVREIEKDMPRPSYTIDTLRELQRTFRSDGPFRLVVGSDVMAETHQWKDWDAIVAEFSPIVVGREGFPHEAVGLRPVFPGISSSMIRRRLAMGLPVDDLVPQAVLKVLPTNRYIWAK